MATTSVLTGSEEVNRRLQELAGAKQKQAVRKASRAALRPTLVAAKGLAPKRSGKMRSGIKLRALARSRRKVGSAVTLKVDGTPVYYSGFIEYGYKAGRRVRNRDLGIAKGARRDAAEKRVAQQRDAARRQIAGQGFLKRAAEQTREQAQTIYQAELTRWIAEFANQAKRSSTGV